MKQGGQPEVEDLDPLIESRSLKPKKVRFGGREWTIDRDFPAAKVVKFWIAVNKNSLEAYAMLVGEADAPALSEIVTALPTEMAMSPLRRIYQIAGVLNRPIGDKDESEGES